jgi:hypothetical protein
MQLPGRSALAPPPALPSDADRRVEQAARNAAWWRAEIAAGRIIATRDLESLLRDLEVAGALR